MFDKNLMDPMDAPVAKYAEVFVTVKERRYTFLNATNFEGKANVSTKEVPRVGATVMGHKATVVNLPFTLKAYKCGEIFDEVVTEFIKTGIMPRFTVQTSNEDPATSIGRSTTIYNNCILDGDVLLSMVGSGDDYIEQEISGYAESIEKPEKYTVPAYMG